MGLSTFLYVPLLLVVTVALIQRAYNLFRNYIEARKLGIHIVVIPVSWHETWWILIRRSLKFLRHVPVLGHWYKFSYLGWTLDHRFKPHEVYGDAFVVVAPKANVVMINDPAAGALLQRDYKTWIKPETLYAVFDTFGPGLVSVNGEDWQRHRRIVNPAFREQNNKMVWEESLRQVNQMLDLRSKGDSRCATLAEMKVDCHLIAMHVLSAAGFSHMHDFGSGLQELPEGKTKSFSDALNFLLMNTLPLLVFGKMELPHYLTWPKLREIKTTINEFRDYMKEIIAYTRATTQSGGGGAVADIASTLIQADEAAKTEEKAAGSRKVASKPNYLSDDELLGNLYAFNVAGFETTAGTLSYAIPFLAVNQQVQDWACEEIDGIFRKALSEQLDYEATFPRLTRCLAIMVCCPNDIRYRSCLARTQLTCDLQYETLRLWGPLPEMARIPAGDGQTLVVGDREIFVPQGTYVSTNFYGIHTDPRWWGPDSLEWKPQRWISKDQETGLETIAPPPAGAVFIGWSTGPRVCPGKKFSQVEFVAVIAMMLHRFRLEPWVMQEKGMRTSDDATRALMDTVSKSQFILTTKMIDPETAGITLVRR